MPFRPLYWLIAAIAVTLGLLALAALAVPAVRRSYPSGGFDPLPISPDGRLYAVAEGQIAQRRIGNHTLGGASMLTVRSSADGGVVRSLAAWATQTVVFSPDLALLATASADAHVQIWRLRDGALLHDLVHDDVRNNLNRAVNTLAFAPDATLIVSAGDGGLVQVWRVSDGRLVQTLELPGRARAAAFAGPNLLVVALDGGDGQIVGLDVHTWQQRWSIPAGGQPQALAVSPSGALLALGVRRERSGAVSLVDLAAATPQIQQISTTSSPVVALSFSADSAELASATTAVGESSPLGSASLLPERQWVEIFPVQPGSTTRSGAHMLAQSRLADVRFAVDGRTLVVSGDTAIQVIDRGLLLPTWWMLLAVVGTASLVGLATARLRTRRKIGKSSAPIAHDKIAEAPDRLGPHNGYHWQPRECSSIAQPENQNARAVPSRSDSLAGGAP
ncbi:MAG: hypothetical protein WCJ55_11595 [Chloroflexales bacterium]